MLVRELLSFGAPEWAVEIWSRTLGAGLLPLQEKAVRAGCLQGGAFVVCGPTGAGKTWVGEAAALSAVTRGRKALLIVPARERAEEQYAVLRQRYQGRGVRVVVGTGLRAEFAEALRRGQFDLGVLVFEKAAALLATAPRVLGDVGAVVVDEVQMLGDRERGPLLEMFLSGLQRLPAAPATVGLSPLIGNAYEVASWLGARVVAELRRPVELRQGVWYQGRFDYREFNSGLRGSEEIGSPQAEQATLEVAYSLAARGEPTALLVGSRARAMEAAETLAARGGLTADPQALAACERLRESREKKALLRCLERGVLFHSADLGDEERAFVESLVRAERVPLVCCTSTLSMGANARWANVVMEEARYSYCEAAGHWVQACISKAEMDGEGGCAGRAGSGLPFGRAIVCARSPLERARMLAEVAEADLPVLDSALPSLDAGDLCLRAHSLGGCASERELVQFLGSTFACYRRGFEPHQRIFGEPQVEQAVGRLVQAGVLRRGLQGDLVPGPLGEVAVSRGLDVQTALFLGAALEALGPDLRDSMAALLVAAGSPAGGVVRAGLPFRRTDHGWRMEEVATEAASHAWEWLQGVVSWREWRWALHKALVAYDYSAGVELPEIQKRYGVSSGALEDLAAQLAWLLEALAEAATMLCEDERLGADVDALAAALRTGIPQEWRGLWPIRLGGIARHIALRLASEALTGAVEIAGAPAQVLEALGGGHHERLLHLARSLTPPPRLAAVASPSGPRLRLTLSQPRLVILSGRQLLLTKLEGRLLGTLAAAGGSVVEYQCLCREVWGDDLTVMPNHVHKLRGRLVRRLEQELLMDNAAAIITTYAGLGLALNKDVVQVSP